MFMKQVCGDISQIQMNIFYLFLSIIIDQHKDPLQYMKKADQHGSQIINYFLNYFIVPCLLSIVVIGAGSVIYNNWKFDTIDPSNLYRAYRTV